MPRRDRHAGLRRRPRAAAPRRRPRAGRGGEGALSGHPGDHRSGDRERLLLRLRPRGALHADDLERSRRACTRSSIATRPSSARSGSATRRLRSFEHRRGLQGRDHREHPAGRRPVTLYRQGDCIDLCRGPHLPSTGRAGQGLQADASLRRLLARRFPQRDAAAHLRHRLGEREGAQGLPAPARGGGEARPSPARPGDGPVPPPGRGARRGVLAPEGLDPVPEPDRLHARAPERGRLPGGEHAARSCRRSLWESVRPLGDHSASTCSPPRPRTAGCSRSSR